MSKNIYYFVILLLGTVLINTVVTKWLYPSSPQSNTEEQLDQVLQGVKQQSASISALESSLKRLGTEVSRLDSKINQVQDKAPSVPTSTTTQLTAPVSDERLTKVDKQLADLEQQLTALLANQNQKQATDLQNVPSEVPDPYAGMTPEQIKQQQELARQQQQQLLNNTISSTIDPSKTSQISSSFESYLNTAKITGSPPQVDCGTTLCRFQFNQATLLTSTGEEVDPMMALMESGAFPADGTQRTIITEKTAQGGMDLYVGNAEDFPKSPTQ